MKSFEVSKRWEDRLSPKWKGRKLGSIFLLLCIVGISCSAIPTRTASEYRLVKRVIDGDTVILQNGEKIRLIGVNTPESVDPRRRVEYFGKEAAAFTKRMVEGKRVRLEFDPANAHRRHEDNTRERRTLAYVFLEDGTHLNAEIIRQGYGFALTRYPFSRMEEFRKLEREARENKRGLWGNNQ